MQREDHLSKIFGLIEEDDNNNYNVRGGDERKTLSQLAGGQYQQKKLFPGEGIKVFRERIFDPLLHGLEYAHMGTIIANSGENGKGISVAFQTAPDIEGGFDQTVRVITKRNGKTMKSSFVMYTEDMEDSSGGKKLADTTWVLEKPLPAPAVGERSSATKIGGETLQPGRIRTVYGTGVTSRRRQRRSISSTRRRREVFTTENLSARVPSCEENDTEGGLLYIKVRTRNFAESSD